MSEAGHAGKQRRECLEDRFEFQGDAVAVIEGPILRTALHRVVERTTEAQRALRLWRKTGTSADRDLRQFWEHERRQVQRLMATAGTADLVVNVLEFVEDEAEFGVVLEDAGMPLSRLRERADRHHWIRHEAVATTRIILWRNLARLAQALGLLHGQGMIDWERFATAFGPLYREGVGRPGLPTRLMVGLHLLKHMDGLSDDAVCARFLDSPYVQLFCGESHFQHALPLDRSSMTSWRKREPPRVRRRLFCLGHAARAAGSNWV